MTSYLLILALLLGLAPAFIAHGKGRNFLFWWLYGVVLGPVALIHAIMLRGGRQPALETAPETRRDRSDSPWPLLLRVASLFAIVIIAVAAYRIIVPPETGKPAMQREIVISSDRTPPGQDAVAPKDTGETGRSAPSVPSAAEAPAPAQPSPTVRVTVRQDRLPQDDAAAKPAPSAEIKPTERDTSTAPDTDKAAAPPPPPPAPAPPQLERTLPLDPVKDVGALAARTAPAEPFIPSETAQKGVAAKTAKSAPSAKARPTKSTPEKSTRVAAKPSAAAPKPAAPDKPSLSDVTAMGEMVLAVQRALAKRGYDPGPANGLAGRKTESAIRKFQADRGLKTTGAIEYEVLEALDIVGPRVFAFQPPPGATPGR